MRPASTGRRQLSFGSVLAEVEGEREDPDRISRPIAYPFASVDPPNDAASAADWDQAFAWIEASDPAPSLSDDPTVIAVELGLAAATTLAELGRARRRFMWANHPDRRPDAPRDLANRRVAIANMLIDRAEAALTAKDQRG